MLLRQRQNYTKLVKYKRRKLSRKVSYNVCRSQTKLSSEIPFWDRRQKRQVTDRPTLNIAQSERVTHNVYVLLVMGEISNNRVETFSITTRENTFSAAKFGS